MRLCKGSSAAANAVLVMRCTLAEVSVDMPPCGKAVLKMEDVIRQQCCEAGGEFSCFQLLSMSFSDWKLGH